MKDIREQFKEECKVINLKYEYPGYIGDIVYVIVTELSEDELVERYRQILQEYNSYIVLSPAFGEIRAEYLRNQKKYEMRRIRSESIFGFDNDTEEIHDGISTQSTEEEYIEKLERKKLFDALTKLTDTQRRRIELYYFENLTLREIAEKEGVGFTKIEKSIKAGIKKLKSQFDY